MPNRITNIEIPPIVKTGQQFEVTVDYTADDDDDLQIVYLGNFQGQPASVPLAAGGQRKTFAVTVMRAGAADACHIEFHFGSRWLSLVPVT